MQKTDARQVADWFLWRAAQDGKSAGMTNLKLQKLLYYAQAWNLTFSDQPLFEDNIEAWVHGPVIFDIYQRFRSSGWSPISAIPTEEPQMNRDDIEHLNEVWDIYGGYSAKYLEALTHHEAPWQLAREGFDEHQRGDVVISHQSMVEYYRGLLMEDVNG